MLAVVNILWKQIKTKTFSWPLSSVGPGVLFIPDIVVTVRYDKQQIPLITVRNAKGNMKVQIWLMNKPCVPSWAPFCGWPFIRPSAREKAQKPIRKQKIEMMSIWIHSSTIRPLSGLKLSSHRLFPLMSRIYVSQDHVNNGFGPFASALNRRGASNRGNNNCRSAFPICHVIRFRFFGLIGIHYDGHRSEDDGTDDGIVLLGARVESVVLSLVNGICLWAEI